MRRVLISAAAGILFTSFLVPSKVSATADVPRTQIGQALPETHLSGVGFSDSIEFIRDITGLNIYVDWKRLEEAGITKDAPVNLRLHNVSVRKTLNMILSEVGGDKLAYDIEGGVITITTKEQVDSKLITRVYPIQDLLMDIPDFIDAPDFSLNSTSNNSNQNPGAGRGEGGGGGGNGELFGGGQTKEKVRKSREERAQDLISLIQSVIQPEIWAENGGKSVIRYFNGNLVITAPRSAQEAIGG